MGLDIGGTTMLAVLCDRELNIVDQISAATPAREGNGAMAACALALARALLERNDCVLSALGVGAAGVIDRESGTVVTASDSFVGWAGTPLGPLLASGLGIPVVLENDVNAFLAGEMAAGAARNRQHVLGITLGTGVGGAVAFDGHIIHGAHGAAGEIGHIPGFGNDPCTCGQRGHLETLASGRSISRRYFQRSGRSRTARDIAGAARLGDADAGQVFSDAGQGVARGILMAAGLADISAAVIGGGVAHAWDLLSPAMEEVLANEPPVNGHVIAVRRSALGHQAVAVGACASALSSLGELPVPSATRH
ncbi:ROK family protein [Arthrobacter dokdonensis]|uniref:ROK family protein n=1 Tax=Arthrobacter dokdonellae TaxID=2211210 RepID=UPI000DE5A7B1|nr:ROK family protein [Arthrobacter dokdonellae]